MFSYRHAFHAGNHADVLKHMMLIAMIRHLTAKPAALAVIDTHAGAGLYRLDGDYAGTSGEAADGILKLADALKAVEATTPATKPVAPMISDYVGIVASFNSRGEFKVYPGSPFIAQQLLRDEARDKLKLFELHPTDSRALAGNVAQMKAGRQVAVERADGFESLKALLPPPSRRALVLIDPSYEIKSDYTKVAAALQDGLKRFATGTYAIWYPIIPRPEAHALPRRLKTLTNTAGKPWLHATLSIGRAMDDGADLDKPAHGPGLTASGMFVVNPPHTLKAALQPALTQLVEFLGRGRGKSFTLESAG